MPKEKIDPIPIVLTQTEYKVRGEKRPLIGIVTDYEETQEKDLVKVGFEVNGPAGRKIASDLYYAMHLFLLSSEFMRKNPALVLGSIFTNIAVDTLVLASTHSTSTTKKFGELLKNIVENEKFPDGGVQVRTRMGSITRIWNDSFGKKDIDDLEYTRPRGIRGEFIISSKDLESAISNGYLDGYGDAIETKKDLAVYLARSILIYTGQEFDITKGKSL